MPPFSRHSWLRPWRWLSVRSNLEDLSIPSHDRKIHYGLGLDVLEDRLVTNSLLPVLATFQAEAAEAAAQLVIVEDLFPSDGLAALQAGSHQSGPPHPELGVKTSDWDWWLA